MGRMRSATGSRLQRIWYGGQPAPAALRALEPAYRLASRLHRWWKVRQRPDDLAAACIVVVGNITVGGSGKTPLVIRLCRILREAGLRPGVVSRGYGRRQKGLRLVSPASRAQEVGDEPVLIAKRSGVPVIVAADRCEAARRLIGQRVNVVIADDGLQHCRLPRDIELCVVDGARGFGNGRLLPAGPLREPLARLGQVDHVIVNGEPDGLPESVCGVPMTLAPGLLQSLEGGEKWRLAQFAGCAVNAVAGIGHPQRFFGLLRQSRLKVNEYPFPDHHAYSARDFVGMDADLPIVMTEKDAVKCRGLGLKNAWFLSVDALLPAAFEASLVAQVVAHLQPRKDES